MEPTDGEAYLGEIAGVGVSVPDLTTPYTYTLTYTSFAGGVPQLISTAVFTCPSDGGTALFVGITNTDPAVVVTGTGPGAAPHVRVLDGATGTELLSFFAYDAAFTGGVVVAAGDVNGDGRADIITGAGPGGGPHVRVLDGATGTELRSFFAYDPAFTGGVVVAAGDVNGDGRADIITGAGPGGGPHVRVLDGATGTELHSFFAYDPAFTGGVFVAAADVNRDGRADIITGAGPGGGPHVRTFDGTTGLVIQESFAYGPDFTGGVRVAAQ
jgi:hypothetical protein